MSNQKNHPLRTKGGSFDVKIERLVFLCIFSLLSDKSANTESAEAFTDHCFREKSKKNQEQEKQHENRKRFHQDSEKQDKTGEAQEKNKKDAE